MGKIIAFIRDFLASKGFVSTFTDGDILRIMARARGALTGRQDFAPALSRMDRTQNIRHTAEELDAMEKAVDAAYERGDPKAEDMDAKLAAVRADTEDDGTAEEEEDGATTVEGEMIGR